MCKTIKGKVIETNIKQILQALLNFPENSPGNFPVKWRYIEIIEKNAGFRNVHPAYLADAFPGNPYTPGFRLESAAATGNTGCIAPVAAEKYAQVHFITCVLFNLCKKRLDSLVPLLLNALPDKLFMNMRKFFIRLVDRDSCFMRHFKKLSPVSAVLLGVPACDSPVCKAKRLVRNHRILINACNPPETLALRTGPKWRVECKKLRGWFLILNSIQLETITETERLASDNFQHGITTGLVETRLRCLRYPADGFFIMSCFKPVNKHHHMPDLFSTHTGNTFTGLFIVDVENFIPVNQAEKTFLQQIMQFLIHGTTMQRHISMTGKGESDKKTGSFFKKTHLHADIFRRMF